jgi:glycosyltransferase involved in cell wall biosynthesis
MSGAGAASSPPPRVSVVVRSYRRLGALAELCRVLARQAHDAFEVIVVEQSGGWSDTEARALAHFLSDGRFVFVRCPPLGGPGARNRGVREARGEIVILVDDDDLPLGDDWIAAHERHFADPRLVGESARQVREPGERSPFVWPRLAERRVLRYSPLKTPWVFARFDRDVAPVEWLHGTNAAFRRAVALRAELWDEAVQNQDEHSFAFRLKKVLAPGEYLAFKAEPPLLRRMDIPGGMDKRFASGERMLRNQIHYQHRVIGRYFPELYRRALPIYHALALWRTMNWLLFDARRAGGLGAKVQEMIALVRAYPQISQDERR